MDALDFWHRELGAFEGDKQGWKASL